MRYIWHTTGPFCMARFLRLPTSKAIRDHVGYLHCNFFNDVDDLTESEQRLCDYLTRQRNSYFTKKPYIHVPVSDGTAAVPTLPMEYTRMWCKTRPPGPPPRSTSRAAQTHDQEDGATTALAHSQDGEHELTFDALLSDAQFGLGITDAQTRMFDNADALRDKNTTLQRENTRLKRKLDVDGKMVGALRKHLRTSRHAPATQSFMRGCPIAARAWLNQR